MAFSVAFALESNLQSSSIARKKSYTSNAMLRVKDISTATVKKMAGSGHKLHFTHLQLAFDRNDNDGVSNPFTELFESG